MVSLFTFFPTNFVEEGKGEGLGNAHLLQLM